MTNKELAQSIRYSIIHLSDANDELSRCTNNSELSSVKQKIGFIILYLGDKFNELLKEINNDK